jgi:hypothetical protein
VLGRLVQDTGEDGAMTEGGTTLEVSRRIEAPPTLIFEILADPRRHSEIDGSDMLRGALVGGPISAVGDTFTMKMHRMGRDYFMLNYVVEFEPGRRIAWEPAPGDLATAGDDPSKVGVPAGYRWGYRLVPDGDHATVVTEFFDCGPEENQWILQREDGQWINGTTSVRASMSDTLMRLERVSTA